MEPRFFIPVVPTLLLNGSRGIGEKSLYIVKMNHMSIEISSNWNNNDNNNNINNNNNNNDNNDNNNNNNNDNKNGNNNNNNNDNIDKNNSMVFNVIN